MSETVDHTAVREPVTKVTDRLLNERLAPSHRVWVDIAGLLEGIVALQVSDVRPGEPIVVRWRVEHGLGGIRGQLYTVQFRIDGELVHQRSGIPVKDATVNGGMYTVVSAGNWQTETVLITQPVLAQNIYRWGQRKLTAHVFTEVAADRKFDGSTRFRIVREAMNASWWEWRVPQFQSIAWKTGYRMAGAFVNRARFASMRSVSVELCEVRSERNPGIDPCGYFGVETQTRRNVGAGGAVDFSFGRKHDWSWIVDVVYIIKGPINKTFAYAAWIEATDQFGNVYSGFCSTRRSRHIFVPKSKRLAAVAAQTASLNAIAFIWMTFLSVTYKLLATYFATIAKDPPDPEFLVHERVPREALPLLEGNGSDHYPASTRLVREAANLAGLEQARTGIRARLIGARMLGAEEALSMQQQDYVELEEEMQQLARGLGDLVAEVERELQDEKQLAPESFDRFIGSLGQGRLPDELRHAIEHDPLGSNEVFDFEALVRNPEVISIVRANGPFVRPLVEALQSFVGEIAQERESILQGEEYVRVSSRPSDVDNHEGVSDDEDPRQRRKRKCDC
jgi:hypothetical protein